MSFEALTYNLNLTPVIAALLPIVNQTGFLAIPPCQSSASMLCHCSSLVTDRPPAKMAS